MHSKPAAVGQLLEAWTRLLQSWAWQPPAPAPSDGGAHAAVAEATSRIVGAVLEATMQDLARGAEDEAGEEAAEVRRQRLHGVRLHTAALVPLRRRCN